MGKGLRVVGERLEQHNVFYIERVDLKEAAEEHYCCYTVFCLQGTLYTWIRESKC